MNAPLLLLWSALSPGARASEVEVLVPTFQSSDARTDDTAEGVRLAVEQAISSSLDTRVVPLSSVPAVGELDAVNYSESCPPGEYVGCASVLGEAGRVSLAVAGVVSPSEEGGVLAEIHVVDVQQSVDLISFVGEFDPVRETGSFARTVAAVVGAAARGEVKAGGDIRAAAPVLNPDRAEKQAAGRQLDQLQKEIGGSADVGDANVGEFVQEKYTTNDLANDMQTDGSKPWDRLGMSAKEYLQYKNSGMNLLEWRQRQVGRKGQLLMRAMAGYGTAPSSGKYYARQGLSEDDLAVIETYGFHTMVDASAGRAGLEVAYGVLPELEVGLQAGWTSGRYVVDIRKITEGQVSNPREPDELANSGTWLGGQVLYAPFPVWPARPVAGLSFTTFRGQPITSHYLIEDGLPEFDRPTSLRLGFVPGIEARMGEHVDVFLHMPLNFAIGGQTGDKMKTGAGVLTPSELGITADPLKSVYAGVQAGIQVRLFGAEPDTRSRADDPLEP